MEEKKEKAVSSWAGPALFFSALIVILAFFAWFLG